MAARDDLRDFNQLLDRSSLADTGLVDDRDVAHVLRRRAQEHLLDRLDPSPIEHIAAEQTFVADPIGSPFGVDAQAIAETQISADDSATWRGP